MLVLRLFSLWLCSNSNCFIRVRSCLELVAPNDPFATRLSDGCCLFGNVLGFESTSPETCNQLKLVDIIV